MGKRIAVLQCSLNPPTAFIQSCRLDQAQRIQHGVLLVPSRCSLNPPTPFIQALKNKNWMLSFDEDNWVTTGSGNMLQVDKAVIHFNARSAAQLRLNNGCADNPVLNNLIFI